MPLKMDDRSNPERLSDRIVELCTSPESVSALLAADPQQAPGDAWDKLYGKWKRSKSPAEGKDGEPSPPVWQDELQRAAKCGKWGPTQPSELFLRVRLSLCFLLLRSADNSRYITMPSVP